MTIKILRLAAFLILGLGVLLSGPTASEADSAKGIVSDSTTDGAEIYRLTCSVCHGEHGDGKAFASESFSTRPQDFTDPKVIKTLGRERMYNAISNGLPNTAMQPFKNQLSDVQINAVVDLIRSKFMKIDVKAEKKSTASP